MSAIVGVSSVLISHLPPVSITNGIIRPSALLSRERNTEVTRLAVEAQRLSGAWHVVQLSHESQVAA